MKFKAISEGNKRIKVTPGTLFTIRAPLTYKKQVIERGNVYVVLGVRQNDEGEFLVDACKKGALNTDLSVRTNALVVTIPMVQIVSVIGYIRLNLPELTGGISDNWITNHTKIPKLAGYFSNVMQQKYL